MCTCHELMIYLTDGQNRGKCHQRQAYIVIIYYFWEEMWQKRISHAKHVMLVQNIMTMISVSTINYVYYISKNNKPHYMSV